MTIARLVPGGDAGPFSLNGTPGGPGQGAPSLRYGLPGGGSPATAGAAGPVIASVSPQIASAGTNTTITITGTGFGTKASRVSPADVGFTSAGGMYWASGRTNLIANPDDIVSWSDTMVRVRVPTGFLEDESTDTASSGSVRLVSDASATSNALPFAVSFSVSGYRWAAAPVFLVNDNCPGVTGGADAARRAAATWNAALPAGYRIDCSGSTTSTVNDYDGVNVIAWGSPAGATVWYDENRAIVEADIFLDPGENWTAGTAGGSVYSIESRMLEALGYCLGIASLAGEEPQGPSDTGKACCLGRDDTLGNMNLLALHPADRAAAAYLYDGGSANPPLLASAFTADTIGGAAPLSVRFANATIGGATGWSWDFGDGGTSAQRSPTHTYSSPGTYTVGLTASAPGYPDDTVRAIGRITVAGAAVQAVPGGAGLPRDIDGDARYEDVNGNGRADFADVVLLFSQMTWIATNEPGSAFDYTANGRIDFADVVWLFNAL